MCPKCIKASNDPTAERVLKDSYSRGLENMKKRKANTINQINNHEDYIKGNLFPKVAKMLPPELFAALVTDCCIQVHENFKLTLKMKSPCGVLVQYVMKDAFCINQKMLKDYPSYYFKLVGNRSRFNNSEESKKNLCSKAMNV